MVDIWGADHHGYVPRVRAALTAMGEEASTLEVLLVQFASLYRGGEKVQMSTRSGSFVTLRELRDEVGNDAARFFYVLRKSEQHMDFDLDLARSESSENPVYYIQYAHARIHSVLRQLRDKGMVWDSQQGIEQFSRLVEPHEKSLMVAIARYPELLESAALQREPHQIAHYLRDLAHELHTYYNAHHFIVEDQELRNARITLISAARQVFVNGLQILGVSAPQEM
jgi:arginyl-tRNA synthetase